MMVRLFERAFNSIMIFLKYIKISAKNEPQENKQLLCNADRFPPQPLTGLF
jgi:hypothetical protein